MKMVCISDSRDITVGLRLAGVQSFIIRDKNKIIEKVKELSKDKEIGIINVTKNVYDIAKVELDEISEKQDLPLIVQIPN